MHKVLLSVLLSAVLIAAGSSVALALQSGGVAYGDLETGNVSGIGFKELDVDLEYRIIELGGQKVIYSSMCILLTIPLCIASINIKKETKSVGARR